MVSTSVTEHGGGLHASSDCMLQCCRCRPGHLVRDICKHQLFVTLQHCLGSGEQLEVCGGYRLVHIKYHIKEIFHFFSAAVILTSRLHEFSNRYKDIEKFCTQDLFITVGVNKNCTLVFVNFSAQDASTLKISVPIIKRRS